MIGIPHVTDMNPLHTFIGLNGGVREFSYLFKLPKLGISLVPTQNRKDATATVSFVQDGSRTPLLLVGDIVSKVWSS